MEVQWRTVLRASPHSTPSSASWNSLLFFTVGASLWHKRLWTQFLTVVTTKVLYFISQRRLPSFTARQLQFQSAHFAVVPQELQLHTHQWPLSDACDICCHFLDLDQGLPWEPFMHMGIHIQYHLFFPVSERFSSWALLFEAFLWNCHGRRHDTTEGGCHNPCCSQNLITE